MKTTRLLTGIVLACLAAPGAWAQAYPSKPIRLISPYPPGGGTDATARIIAQALAEKNIARVSLINRFLEESTPGKDLLYWPDDTHWNARGIGVAVNVVVQMLGQ